jgi:type VI secretion system secreted protein VgrG
MPAPQGSTIPNRDDVKNAAPLSHLDGENEDPKGENPDALIESIASLARDQEDQRTNPESASRTSDAADLQADNRGLLNKAEIAADPDYHASTDLSANGSTQDMPDEAPTTPNTGVANATSAPANIDSKPGTLQNPVPAPDVLITAKRIANAGQQVNATRLGNLSMKYETGKSPAQYREAAGVVSTGKDDDGGISYGAYQLSSQKGQVQKFLQNEGSPWALQFNGLNPTQSGNFAHVWKAIAKNDPDKFFAAQHAYIEQKDYQPAVDYVRAKTGLDIDAQPQAVRDAAWSTSVQHGKAKYILADAVKAVPVDQSSPDYPAALVNSIYDKRAKYVSGLGIPNQKSLMERYADEKQRALNMLNNDG